MFDRIPALNTRSMGFGGSSSLGAYHLTTNGWYFLIISSYGVTI
ncbi:hypothetical protein N9478_08245 [Gammaproteobacteria bacterium]|nr:hypothetical protein [Gammaproteobacteria bacterium]